MSTLFGRGVEHLDGGWLTVIPGAVNRDGGLHGQVIVTSFDPGGVAEGHPRCQASIDLTLDEVDELIEHLISARAEAVQDTTEQAERDESCRTNKLSNTYGSGELGG